MTTTDKVKLIALDALIALCLGVVFSGIATLLTQIGLPSRVVPVVFVQVFAGELFPMLGREK